MFGFALQHRRWPILAGLLITCSCLWLSLNSSQWLVMQRLEYLLYDLRFNTVLAAKPPLEQEQSVVIIDIDEASLAEVGRWPWSRATLGQLAAGLADAGAVVVAFDVVFSEAERNPLDLLQQSLEQHGQPWQPPATWHTLLDADAQFAAQFSQSDVVLGYFFLDDQRVQVGQLPEPVYRIDSPLAQQLVSIQKPGFAANVAVLQQAAAFSGFVTTFADSDGAIRRTPLVIRHQDALYPSLALATVMTYLFDQQLVLHTSAVGQVQAMRYLGVGKQLARTDAVGRVTVPYLGAQRAFPYVSASDVLQGKVSPDLLEGKIALVGTSAMGLSDLRTTPVGTQYPGVEVHANVIEALLTNGFPYQPEWEAGATFSLILLVGTCLAWYLPRFGPLATVLCAAVTLLGLVGINYYLWDAQQLDLPLATQLLLVLLLTLFNLVYGFLREHHNRQQLRGMFDQYVPPAHIERMIKNPKAYQFAGESKELTVLFSDIRFFTTISEQLSATELKTLLNSYFTPITKVIFDHDGTIDKYVGDMVMAFWGAPIDDEHHAQKAVLSALAMQQVTAQLRSEFKAQGLPEIHIGIGLNTGPMNVGDMGSTYRRSYTVLGDAVNLGSRLESITKYYGLGILVSETTKQQTSDIAYRYIDCIQVKGKTEPVKVYEPLGLWADVTDEQREELALQERAQAHYLQGEWEEAEQLFNALSAMRACKLYDIYLQRLTHLRTQARAPWDGVFVHKEK